MHLIKEYSGNPKYKGDPLGLKQYVGHWDRLWTEMSNGDDVFIKMVGLKLADVQDFYRTQSRYPRIRRMYETAGDLEKDQLLQAGYRTSFKGLLEGHYLPNIEKSGHVYAFPRSDLSGTYYNYFADPRSPYAATNSMLEAPSVKAAPTAPKGRPVFRSPGR